LNFRFVDGGLVANVARASGIFAKGNFKHSHDASEAQVVQTFLQGLVLVHDGDVADLVQLVKTLDSVLDQLGELYCALDGVRNTLDDDMISAGCAAWSSDSWSSAEKLMSSL